MAENKLSSLISLFDEECDEEFAEESVEVESNATPPISQPRQSGSSVGFQFTSSAPAVIQASSSCKAFDPDFGVRVSNPRISLDTANAYCTGMVKVRISQLQPTSIPADEWATMAVIVEKSESRKSARNNEYMIWKASDLINPQVEPCRLLLFGDCVKKHWKLQIGTVVIITNAQLADSTMESKGTALKIFKATQALEIGFCPDFGHCKAIKLDGEKCTKFVNISKSENCAHHILSAARRLSANRGVFSSPKANNWRLKKGDLPESSMGLVTVKRDSNKQFVNPNNFHAKRALKGKDDKSLIPKSRVPPYPAIKMNSPKPANGQAPAKPSPQNPRLMLSQMAPKSMKEFILQESNRPKLASKAERGSPLINLASPEKKKSRLTLNEELKIV